MNKFHKHIRLACAFSLERDWLQRPVPVDPRRNQHDTADGPAVPNSGLRVLLRLGRGLGRRHVFSGQQRALGQLHVRPERLQADLQATSLRNGDHLGDARVDTDRRRPRDDNGSNDPFYLRFMVSVIVN